jgi:AcrR family transcriptional regulator
MGMSKAGVLHYFPHKEDILHALLDPLFEKVEKLVEGQPEPRELLEKYLDLMLEERELIALLGQDLSVLAQPEIGQRVYELNNRLLELASGSRSDFTHRVQAEHALGGMRSVVVRFGGEDDETLREESLKAAASTFNIKP